MHCRKGQKLLLMSSTGSLTTIDDKIVYRFFHGIAALDDTSAIELTYNHDTDWTTNTHAELLLHCQGIDPDTGLVLGVSRRPVDPILSPDSLRAFCVAMRDCCSGLRDFQLPPDEPLSLSTTYAWIDSAARHMFGAPPRT